MVIDESVAERPSTAAFHGALLAARDEGFETRWAAWVARRYVDERRTRRRFFVSAGVIAIASAIAAFFLLS